MLGAGALPHGHKPAATFVRRLSCRVARRRSKHSGQRRYGRSVLGATPGAGALPQRHRPAAQASGAVRGAVRGEGLAVALKDGSAGWAGWAGPVVIRPFIANVPAAAAIARGRFPRRVFPLARGLRRRRRILSIRPRGADGFHAHDAACRSRSRRAARSRLSRNARILARVQSARDWPASARQRVRLRGRERPRQLLQRDRRPFGLVTRKPQGLAQRGEFAPQPGVFSRAARVATHNDPLSTRILSCRRRHGDGPSALHQGVPAGISCGPISSNRGT